MMIINLQCILQATTLGKQDDVIKWLGMKDGDINRDKVRIIYENDEIGC